MSHSLLFQEKNSISFFKFGNDPSIQKCKMMGDVVDFSFESSSSNILYVLNSEGEVYVFELSTNQYTCKTIGKVTVNASSKSQITNWGPSLLAITNADTI